MGRKIKRTIKITEFPSASVITPIRKKDGSLDKLATHKIIDEQFEKPKEIIPKMGNLKDKTILRDIAKGIKKEKTKEKSKKELKEEVKE